MADFSLNAPTTWADVTIQQLISLQDAQGTDVASLMRMVKVFNPDIDPYTLEIDQVIECASKIFEVIGRQPKVEAVDSYVIDGETFKVNPPDCVDFGQFIDVTALRSEDEKQQIRNMSLIISIVTDGITDVRGFAEKVAEKVDAVTGMGILLFFSENLISSIKNTPHYSTLLEKLTENSENK